MRSRVSVASKQSLSCDDKTPPHGGVFFGLVGAAFCRDSPAGDIRYSLKTPYRDGTTHVIFEPLDFIARLAALVPRPRVNLTRFHGIFAPNSRWRARITPARRGKRRSAEEHTSAPQQRHALTWAQRLKRVFRIDIETCEQCGQPGNEIAGNCGTALCRICLHLSDFAH